MLVWFRPCTFPEGLDKVLDIHVTFFKLLSTLSMIVDLKYHINLFFKFIIIKTQLITRY